MPRPRKEELARRLLQILLDGDVEFVVAGGVAARAHGLRKKINDLDVIYRRSHQNFRRLVTALAPLNPYPRGVAPGQNVPWNTAVFRNGYSFLMRTDLGDLDLIAKLSAVGTWQAAKRRSVRKTALGIECDCLELDALILNLQASGRPKDIRLAERLTPLKTAS